MYGLGVPPDGLNVYVTDDCLYTVTNFKRDPDTGSLAFEDELIGDPRNGDGLGCLKSLSFTDDGVRWRERGGGRGRERENRRALNKPLQNVRFLLMTAVDECSGWIRAKVCGILQ